MKATTAQVKTIRTLRGKLKLDEGEYYGMLDGYGVAHSAELSFDDARNLIDNLARSAEGAGVWENRGRARNGGRKKYDELEGRPCEMATPKQLRMIEAMWADVSYAPREKQAAALRKFISSKVKVSDLRFLTQEHVVKIIRTLRAMQGKTERKAA